MGEIRLVIGSLFVVAVVAAVIFTPVISNALLLAIVYPWLIGIAIFGMVLCEDYIEINKER